MVERLSLSIAGVTIGLSCDPSEMQLKVEGAATAFLVNDANPDLTVRAAWSELSEATRGEKVFDSGSLWQLYRENGSYLFRFTSPAFGSHPYKTASFNKDFTQGRVHLHRAFFSPDAAVYPLEYPLDELLIINWLASGKGVEAHSCGLVDASGNGHLFVGQSGKGKTTIARLWQKRNGVKILGDDRIIVREDGGNLWMYGTPWHRERSSACPARAPLTRVYFLKHAKKNELVSQGTTESLAQLFSRCFLPFYSPDGLKFTLGFLERIVRTVPCYELGFVPDDSVIALLEELGAGS
jgi:hypothetical protein